MVCSIIAQDDQKVRKEAIWALANLFEGGTKEQIQHCVNHVRTNLANKHY